MSDTAGAVDVSQNMSDAHVQNSVVPGESPANTPATTTGPADTAVSGQPKEGAGDTPQPTRDRRTEKRIASLTRKNDEAQREIGYWKALAESKGSTPSTAQPDAKPQPNQYQSYDEYVDALTDWKVDQKLKAGNGNQPKEQPQPANSKASRNDALAERLFKDSDGMEDFEGVMRIITAPGFPVSAAMRDYLEDAERPALMAQWLADHPRQALRISGMDPVDADAELDKVARGFAPKPAQTSKAPPPGPTVGGRAVVTRSPEEQSMDEYAGDWHARQAKRQR